MRSLLVWTIEACHVPVVENRSTRTYFANFTADAEWFQAPPPRDSLFTMQRDMGLIRQILLELEQHQHGIIGGSVTIHGFSDDQVGYHLKLMMESGLIEGKDVTCMSDTSPRVLVRSVTWKGHDVLDSVRDPKVWNSVQTSVESVGSVNFEIFEKLATEALKRELKLS